MNYRIFNVRTDVNACGCTRRGCTDTVRESALKVDSWRKKPSLSGVPVRRWTSWATSPPLKRSGCQKFRTSRATVCTWGAHCGRSVHRLQDVKKNSRVEVVEDNNNKNNKKCLIINRWPAYRTIIVSGSCQLSYCMYIFFIIDLNCRFASLETMIWYLSYLFEYTCL